MSHKCPSDDAELQRQRAQLPTFTDTRDTATRAVTETARDIGVDLSEADVRSLALAVVDAIEKGVYLRGVDLAYSIVSNEVDWFHHDLVAPTAAAARIDREAAQRLHWHQQYAAGMSNIRDRLRSSFLRSLRQWLGAQQPMLQAPPVVPTPVPAGTAAARQRSATRAGAA